jgi:hypothetical protein
MPDTDLRAASVRRAFEVALNVDGGTGWTPPEPDALDRLLPAYTIEALIGRGGMGAVYRARQKSLDRLVAIKLLPFELGVQEDFAERFRREATALARLNHPHIVAVHDFGQADDGHFFMVMEYVAGSDLAARLREGRMPPAEALAVVRQVCEALEFAHANGVVHRDIKPGNILLDAEGRVKVTDFGIAQLASEAPGAALTATGTLLGTPEYVAPEQTQRAAEVDHRADIFSVGVMLYELLTGQLPRGVFRPLAQLAPESRELDPVITRALQGDPAKRYPAVREMREELAACGPRRSQRRQWVALGLLAMAGASAAAWQWWPEPLVATAPAAPAPFVNSLGQRFVPGGTPDVLFCTTETRVRDFAAYVTAQDLSVFPAQMWVNYTGGERTWQTVLASWRDPSFPQGNENPVVGVTQHEAGAFCEWLTAHERASGRIGPADHYRLPTNAEWSVAAGLDADTLYPSGMYPWGTGFPPGTPSGNYASEEIRAAGDKHIALPVFAGYRDGHAFTAPVGSFAANARGLYDLGGNVWEWTDDNSAERATLRGGGWVDSKADKLDVAFRALYEPGLRSYTVGFRVVLARKIAATAPTP